MSSRPLLPWHPAPDPKVLPGDVARLVAEALRATPEGRAAIEREEVAKAERRRALLKERPGLVTQLEKAGAARVRAAADGLEKLEKARAAFEAARHEAFVAANLPAEALALEQKLRGLDNELLETCPEPIAAFLAWLAAEVDAARHADPVRTYRTVLSGARKLVTSTAADQQSWMLRALETRREVETLHLELLDDAGLEKRLAALREKLGDWRDAREARVPGAPQDAA
jgi:hypothetical protein